MRLPNCRAIVDLDFLFWTTGHHSAQPVKECVGGQGWVSLLQAQGKSLHSSGAARVASHESVNHSIKPGRAVFTND